MPTWHSCLRLATTEWEEDSDQGVGRTASVGVGDLVSQSKVGWLELEIRILVEVLVLQVPGRLFEKGSKLIVLAPGSHTKEAVAEAVARRAWEGWACVVSLPGILFRPLLVPKDDRPERERTG